MARKTKTQPEPESGPPRKPGAVLVRPAKPCYCCRRSAYWRLAGPDSPARPWICARCHPPVTHLPESEIERLDIPEPA